MDMSQPEEDVIANDCNIINEHQHNEAENNMNTITIKSDNGFNEEHQIKMKKKKQAKKEAKQQRKTRRQELLSNRSSTTFFGKHKWLGGAVDPTTGKIYGIPSNTYQIICITPSSSITSSNAEISTIPLPNEFQEGEYKWLRGLVYAGYLYGVPAWNVNGILKVSLDPSLEGSTSRVKVLPLPNDPSYYRTNPIVHDGEIQNEDDDVKRNVKFSDIDRGRWMWHGGTVGKCSDEDESAAAIYAIPSNAQHVLKIYLDGSDKVEEIGPPLREGQNKWYAKPLQF